MHTETIASLVRGYRDRIARDPELFCNEDAVYWLINDTSKRTWTPSEIGSALRITTDEAREYLQTLYLDGFIGAILRGAWTRYTSAAWSSVNHDGLVERAA